MLAFDSSLNVLRAKDKLLCLDTIQSILLPNFGIGGDRGAFAIDNNFSDVFLFSDCQYNLTTLGGLVRKASNMPQLLIDLVFLNNNISKETDFGRRWWPYL